MSAAMLLVSLLILAVPPDVAALKPAQRVVYDKVAKEEFCSCTSSLTLAACNATKPTCKTADHLSVILARLAQVGLSDDEVAQFMSGRVSGPMCAKPRALKFEDAPSKGAKDAPLTLIEFADFRCPHCRDAAPWVHATVEKYAKRLRFIYVPYPLQNNLGSITAASAMLAAEKQGKAWEMHAALFASGLQDFDESGVTTIARKIGLDLAKFGADLKSKAVQDRVTALKDAAVAAGIEATPTFFLNGRQVEPDPVVYPLGERFEMELDRNAGVCQ
jgi:protein-disulfide isomerase